MIDLYDNRAEDRGIVGLHVYWERGGDRVACFEEISGEVTLMFQ